MRQGLAGLNPFMLIITITDNLSVTGLRKQRRKIFKASFFTYGPKIILCNNDVIRGYLTQG